MYEKLRAEVDAELRSRMIQFNAALVAADISWWLDPVAESQHDQRMFSHHRVPSTPTGPPEYDYPHDFGIGTRWVTLFDLFFPTRICEPELNHS